ncbi:MAG: flagellar hook-associated protein FlgK [Myxococcales bacterium]|nr:flagellar hook-associated protein FlgK [Myxococcales bacterium]MDD9965670.1 flagellar hook-associated protein FlgK [Myxococcales bacterium]
MSINRILNIGHSGMVAASLGTAATSHNITNSSTEGYSRQRVAQKPRPIHHGGGLAISSPTRVQDSFVDRRLLSAISLEGEASARSDSLRSLDSMFADIGGAVGDALDNFESAIADLSNDPDSDAARQLVLTRTTQLAQSFNQASADLDAAQDDANGRIRLALGQLNEKLQTIGDLGRDIVSGSTIGEDVSTLMDQRDQLVREVAEYLPVTVLDQPHGAVSVLLAGSRSLVPVDGPVPQLLHDVDANGNTTILRQGSGAPEDITSLITSGKIAGYLSARDGAIADAQADLDQLAYDIATQYNAVHAAGQGRDGASRNLFEVLPAVVPPTGSAEALAISADVVGNPDGIAAALDGTLPSDNRNALALLDLAQTDIASGGTASASEAFSAMLADVGISIQSANTKADNATVIREQAQAMRDAISGVSTDEEMVALMQFQRAYQASLRVVETADAMLNELLNMRR